MGLQTQYGGALRPLLVLLSVKGANFGGLKDHIFHMDTTETRYLYGIHIHSVNICLYFCSMETITLTVTLIKLH